MTVPDADILRVLERVLPARFGGGPTDYQLVEDEAGGHPRLRLLVHPRLGPLEPAAVADAFLAAVGAASPTRRVMSLAWRGGDTLHVERRVPYATRAGKILHVLSLARAGAPGTGREATASLPEVTEP